MSIVQKTSRYIPIQTTNIAYTKTLHIHVFYDDSSYSKHAVVWQKIKPEYADLLDLMKLRIYRYTLGLFKPIAILIHYFPSD